MSNGVFKKTTTSEIKVCKKWEGQENYFKEEDMRGEQ